MNSYSVTFGYTQYLVQHSKNDTEGKKTTIRHYLMSAKIASAKTHLTINLWHFYKSILPVPTIELQLAQSLI